MSTAISAASPQLNASVKASAGTGKTWLLVTRLIRLLLTGAEPESILAITFTRKAAAEMHQRLLTRLFELVSCDEAALTRALEAMGLPGDAATKGRARRLYEELLTREAQVNITTFHAFCQNVLRRFPLEADVPPGFEVIDNTGLLEQEAWDAIFAKSTREPDSPLARSLEVLFERCSGLHGTRAVLSEFLYRRSDWLAYTQHADDPVRFATDALAGILHIRHTAPPEADFFDETTTTQLQEFHELLLCHPTKKNQQHAELLAQALDDRYPREQRFLYTRRAFFTKDDEPFSRKPSNTQAQKMGEQGQARFLEIHHRVCEAIQEIDELQRRAATFKLSSAWFVAGVHLLTEYQTLKNEQRLLDFADLEWKAYRLLTQAEHLLWVQYKLDQAIDHVLVDEFQDTNPTQWHLIRPVLQELADAQDDRQRSVFIVGDDKQSIYRFRRAEPRLFDMAQQWLQGHADSAGFVLDTSFRSAPAVIDFVNQLFAAGALRDRLSGFEEHKTHHTGMWGRVEVWPVVATDSDADNDDDAPVALRNPLHQPRPESRENLHYTEGQHIADRIHALVGGETSVRRDDGHDGPVAYSDMVILLRDRTHASSYELALRDAGIPYLGISRGSLLSSLEIRDMMALLNTLIAPYNDLDLATVLRSPVFNCSDEDLISLADLDHDAAHRRRSWRERLAAIAPQHREDAPLRRAHHWLTRWRDMADRIPVHDLLDRIYCEGNVMARYEHAYPRHMRNRVRANLTRFIELALEVDSGRYPSLTHFLTSLRNLQEQGHDGPDEGTPPSMNAVRLMTIHGAKGMEFPVVFLADTARGKHNQSSYHTIVSWPPDHDRPAHFYLTGKRSAMDEPSRRLYERELHAIQREEVNLLYVAITRAKQLLVITGYEPARQQQEQSWYELIEQAIAPQGLDTAWIHESGQAPTLTGAGADAQTVATGTVDPRLSQPFTSAPVAAEQAPSDAPGQTAAATGQADAQTARSRGTAIHRMLELLADGRIEAGASPPAAVAAELGIDGADTEFTAWWQEACNVFLEPRLRHLFNHDSYLQAYNEVPIHYASDQEPVFGIIDRLVVYEDEVHLIDYKTHAGAQPGNLALLAQPYISGMTLYSRGVQRLWPHKTVRARLLFTACAELYEINSGMEQDQ